MGGSDGRGGPESGYLSIAEGHGMGVITEAEEMCGGRGGGGQVSRVPGSGSAGMRSKSLARCSEKADSQAGPSEIVGNSPQQNACWALVMCHGHADEGHNDSDGKVSACLCRARVTE